MTHRLFPGYDRRPGYSSPYQRDDREAPESSAVAWTEPPKPPPCAMCGARRYARCGLTGCPL